MQQSILLFLTAVLAGVVQGRLKEQEILQQSMIVEPVEGLSHSFAVKDVQQELHDLDTK